MKNNHQIYRPALFVFVYFFLSISSFPVLFAESFAFNSGFIEADFTREYELLPNLESALSVAENTEAVIVSANSKYLVDIRKLIHLKFLYLDETFTSDSYYLAKKGIETFFKIFGELPELEYVCLYDSRLLPFIGNLNQLKGLKIKNFDWNIFQNNIRNYENLEVLIIEDSKAAQLPNAIGQLKSLKQLELNTINVNSLPELTRLQNLIVLQITIGKVTKLPPSITVLENLKYLKITGLVFFKEFPKEICALKNLEKLYFELRNAHPVPDEIGNLSKLRFLYFYDCQNIEGFPATVENFTELEEIYLSDARNNIDLSALKFINHPFSIILNRCNYVKLSQQLSEMKNLKALIVPSNILASDLNKLKKNLPPEKVLKYDVNNL